ncbi:FecR family protein [Chryseolinea serpens]|uniref:FecR family protein n=1 Tax=Chryseolinea serpens TaxID=947013 RepID=A0A1M5MPF4_9BACT|nr:FecR domain-containing protein [Chryseolinea serpens]SHG78643.1 FecR family protein [Chryseolinea serpens]
MAIDKKSYSLLASYLSGNISTAERAIVEKWIDESLENKQVFEEAQKIWLSTSVVLPYKDIDSAQLLRNLHSRIVEKQRLLEKVVYMIRPHKLYWRIAAGVSLLMISYFVIRWATRENFIIESGNQVATIYLPDSTKVWLNVDSRLTYPRKFDVRKVELQGEAFFSVRKNTSDFTISTTNTLTKVLGTSFNVKEQGDSLVTLTVAKGTVKFSTKHSESDESMFVKANQMAVFEPQSKLQKKQNNDPSFAEWREQNNPAFLGEKSKPALFLSNAYTWRKNRINQSVIDGTLTNKASLAAYKNVVFEVNYIKHDGTAVTVNITITDTIYPGNRLSYRRRLLDIFSETQSVVVTLKSAEVTSTNSY